jgi:hypothetical protein
MVIHIECLPDETLLKSLGYSKKELRHHQRKPRVFGDIRNKQGQIALVDEDPGSARHPYEKQLVKKQESHGVFKFRDELKGNTVLMLRVKLEDWIIDACKKSSIDIVTFGLPERPNDLHDVINNRLPAFQKLLSALTEVKNPSLSQLRNWLNEAQS